LNKPPIHHAIVRELYSSLERLEADPYLLAIVGSWGDAMSDEDTLDALKHWNAGTFKIEMIASTGPVEKIRAAAAPKKPRKPRGAH
jgi:hypothetical protein